MSAATDTRRVRRTVGSMRWAAWADALGFISELTSEAGLRRRLHGRALTEPMDWTRRVGGKFGANVRLPAGCYSDDTQLRLATARAVHATGFDVEAFAQVELSVWPTYALGGGHASKAAAANIVKPTTPWFGNFYDGWLDAGGNGVAMRIQPHVWAAPKPATIGQHILDVIVNGATSHGHPRAFVGAVLHAFSLGTTLQNGHVPAPKWWPELADSTEQAVKLIDENPPLASLWRPAWEKRAGASFAEAWRHTVDECRQMLTAAAHAVTALSTGENRLGTAATAAYDELVAVLELRTPSTRGNGTATAIAALALAAAAPADPAGASRLAAQAIGTDTDTIATMAAALIGATDTAPEPLPVLDAAYLTAEATRLAMIADGQATAPFSYPDLLHWTPPRTQLDAVGLAGSHAALAGLGWLKQVEDSQPAEARGTKWIWTRSDFGATFLVKQRPTLRELSRGNWPVRRERLVDPKPSQTQYDNLPNQQQLYDTANMNSHTPPPPDARIIGDTDPARTPSNSPAETTASPDPVNIDQMLIWVARRGYSETAIGYATRRIAEIGTREQLVAFTMALRSEIRNFPQ